MKHCNHTNSLKFKGWKTMTMTFCARYFSSGSSAHRADILSVTTWIVAVLIYNRMINKPRICYQCYGKPPSLEWESSSIPAAESWLFPTEAAVGVLYPLCCTVPCDPLWAFSAHAWSQTQFNGTNHSVNVRLRVFGAVKLHNPVDARDIKPAGGNICSKQDLNSNDELQ